MKTFIEVCSGCGGLGTGLINADFAPLLLIDRDKNCIEIIKFNHNGLNLSTKNH